MTLALVGLVDLLLAAAIAVQLYYVRGLTRTGVEVSKATKVVVYVNIVMLSVVLIGVTAYGLLNGTGL